MQWRGEWGAWEEVGKRHSRVKGGERKLLGEGSRMGGVTGLSSLILGLRPLLRGLKSLSPEELPAVA